MHYNHTNIKRLVIILLNILLKSIFKIKKEVVSLATFLLQTNFSIMYKNFYQKAKGVLLGLALLGVETVVAQNPFPATVIRATNSPSPFATTQNPFAENNCTTGRQDLKGQCTWYVAGRIQELRAAGLITNNSANVVYNALCSNTGRNANRWHLLIPGTWRATSSSQPLPMDQRKPGMIVTWNNGSLGHVAFVEEVSADKTRFRISEFNVSPLRYSETWLNFSSNRFGGYGHRFYQLETGLPIPTISSPTADATMQNLPLRATWGAITGADAYRVQVSKSLSGWTAQGGWLSVTSPPTPSVPVNSNTSSPSLSAALEAGTVYYISVRCNIPGRGVSNYSTPIKFTTRVAAPVLLTPANNATAIMAPVNLVANNVSGADSYRHQISTSLANWTPENGFTTSTSPSSTVPVNVHVQSSNPNFIWRGTTTGVYSAPQSNVTYYWTMRVNVPGKGYSQYCTPRRFTVAILPSLNFSPMTFSNLPATASTQNLLITSTGGLTSMTSAPNWVSPSQNGISIGTIRLSVAGNPNNTARSGLIVIRLNGIERSIPISQVAGYLTPSITALSNLPNTALTRSVSVSASALFTATSNVTWATVRVNGNTLIINVLANRDPSLRSGTITIRQGNITKVIAISQAKRSNLVADGNNNANAAMQQQNGVTEAAQEKEVAEKEVDTKPSMLLGEEATTTKKSQIYPNPVQLGDNLTLKLQSELDKEVLFEIVDLEGKVVLTLKQVCFKGENFIQLNTNMLSNGVHFIRNSLDKEVLKFEVLK